jgi:signal peptidase I
MQPTLLIGDHILVNKFIYGVGIPFTDKKLFDINKPERGDVIVFIYPEDESKDYIKRVIGLPGDTINIINKQIFINGKPYHDEFGVYDDPLTLARGQFNSNRDNFGPVTVPPDSLFVMGDNRDHSSDSRFWGFVTINKVRGKAFIIYWSWEKMFKNFRLTRIGRLIE